MLQQLVLPGLEPTGPRKNGLFLGILLDGKAAMDVDQLAQGQRATHGLKGKLIGPERYHISLYDLGTYDELPADVLASAQEAGAAINLASFDVALNCMMSFNRQFHGRPLVLRGDEGLIGLRRLHKTLGLALMKVGLKRFVGSDFTPHVTLLYDRRSVLEQSIGPIILKVRAFALIHSDRGNSKYYLKGSWPLRG